MKYSCQEFDEVFNEARQVWSVVVVVVAHISVCMVGHEPTHYERKVPTIGEFCQRLESRLFKTYNTREAFKTIAIAMRLLMFPIGPGASSIDFLLKEDLQNFLFCPTENPLFRGPSYQLEGGNNIHLETGRRRYSLPPPPPPPPPV